MTDTDDRLDALEAFLARLEHAWCEMKISDHDLVQIVGSDKNAVTRAGRLIDQLDRTHARLVQDWP